MRFLVGGGPGDAYGDAFDKVGATEVSEIKLEGARYILLKLDENIDVKGLETDHVLVKGRYVGQTLDDIRDDKDRRTSGTVALYLVEPTKVHHAGKRKFLRYIKYNGVGSCDPA